MGGPAIGRRVRHPAYGLGRVVAVERAGLVLRVRFDRYPGLDVGLPAALLRPVAGAGDETAAPPAPPRGFVFERRQAIEALRLGVVPPACLDAYTVGRDQETAAFRRLLSSPAGGRALALLGDYGAGKTHLLELFQTLALEAGWAVGRAWLDPQEAPPNRPRRVYAAFVRSLVDPREALAGAQGLWPLLAAAGRKGRPFAGADGTAHVFLTPAVRFAAALDEALARRPDDEALVGLQQRFLDWIEGRATGINLELERELHRRLHVPGRVLALSDFRTLAKVYGYLLSGLGALARFAGRRGLCLLLDETELFASLPKDERARAVEVFRVLLAAALPAAGERALDLEGVGAGGRGLIRRLPPRFGEGLDLVLVLAATPGSESETFLRAHLPRDRVLELRPLARTDYERLAARIARLYREAYPELPESVFRELSIRAGRWLALGPGGGPRAFAKRAVDFLDHLRLARGAFA